MRARAVGLVSVSSVSLKFKLKPNLKLYHLKYFILATLYRIRNCNASNGNDGGDLAKDSDLVAG